MKLSADSEIRLEKLTHYLLVPKTKADKSKFLSRAGYSIEDAETLIEDIRSQILPLDATFAGTTEFGDFFSIRAVLRGPNGVSLRVKTIWIREHLRGHVRFVTLLPDKSKRHEI